MADAPSLSPRFLRRQGGDFDRVGRTLLSVAFDVDFDFDSDVDFDSRCHPEEAESHAKRATPNEGPVQLASRTAFDAGIGLPVRRHNSACMPVRCESSLLILERVPRPCLCGFCRDRAGVLT